MSDLIAKARQAQANRYKIYIAYTDGTQFGVTAAELWANTPTALRIRNIEEVYATIPRPFTGSLINRASDKYKVFLDLETAIDYIDDRFQIQISHHIEKLNELEAARNSLSALSIYADEQRKLVEFADTML